jgi:hypothetical protein
MTSLMLSVVLVASFSVVVAGGPTLARVWRRAALRHTPKRVLAAQERRRLAQPVGSSGHARAGESVEHVLSLAELRRGG